MNREVGESVSYRITKVLARTTERLTHAEIVAAVGNEFASQVAANLNHMRRAGRVTRTHLPSKGVRWTYQLRRRKDVKDILTPEDLASVQKSASDRGAVVTVPLSGGRSVSFSPAEAREVYTQLKSMFRR